MCRGVRARHAAHGLPNTACCRELMDAIVRNDAPSLTVRHNRPRSAFAACCLGVCWASDDSVQPLKPLPWDSGRDRDRDSSDIVTVCDHRCQRAAPVLVSNVR